MKNVKNKDTLKMSSNLADRLEHFLSMVSNQKIFERMVYLEERIKQLECVDEMAMRLDNLEGSIWTSKEVLTSNEAAIYLGIENSYLYKLTCQKKIPYYKPNDGRIYFKKRELDD